ncbi:hypothetical protein sos41_23760 [Alphaproteobacteria bacterium SO-S41]|nr:hypothetical protein sos41_23760 [Alphaproteobacteria bacterium SO-S41]
MTAAPLRSVAIVGGGVSGALTAVHLARLDPHNTRVTLFERASRQARGIAYDTSEPGHLLNVRAANMSAFPDRPDHFENWLRARTDAETQIARTPAGDFVARALYGEYLADVLQRSCLEDGGGCIAIRRADVAKVERVGAQFVLTGSDGRTQTADDVVFAMGNVTEGFDAAGPVFRNPWAPNAVRHLDPQRPVLIQGTGLTMIDTVIALRRHGFAGPIFALSRRGLLPQAHAAAAPRGPIQLGSKPLRLSEIVRQMRGEAQAAMVAGESWRSVVDALRPVTQDVWRQLTHRDKARFLRHIRPFWDAHRHRIAPPIAAAIERERREGGLTILTGRLFECRDTPDGVEVSYHPRGGGAVRTIAAQRMIVATGIPDLGSTRDELVSGLAESGLARFDALGLGLDVDPRLGLLDKDGKVVAGAWALGPLVRGVFWECTALPDIRVQAVRLAETIIADAARLSVPERMDA